MTRYDENLAEQALLEWLGALGYEILHGPDLGPGEPGEERGDYGETLLRGRLRAALRRLNPDLSDAALAEAERVLAQVDTPSLVERNRRFHRRLVDGVEIEVAAPEGGVRGERVRLVDFDDPAANEWVALNQLTVVEHATRRADVVVYLNGLPLAVCELKNPADEDATIRDAFNQLQTYKAEIPALFWTNELLVVSDGVDAGLRADRPNRARRR